MTHLIHRHHRYERFAIAGLCVIVLAVSSYVAFGTNSVFGQAEPPQIVFRETPIAGTPTPLNAEQCDRAKLMLDASYVGLRNTMASDANAVRELDAEYATSHAWIASGCPPHPTLGFYPNGIGEGGTWRLMEHQAFGITSMTWEAPTEAPSP